MVQSLKDVKHKLFLEDLEGLDGSLKSQAMKKIDNIINNSWGREGHLLKGDLAAFRSASFGKQLWKIMFSYCAECRKLGRNSRFIGECDFCEEMGDDTVIFWRILPHSNHGHDAYRVASSFLTKLFPPSKK